MSRFSNRLFEVKHSDYPPPLPVSMSLTNPCFSSGDRHHGPSIMGFENEVEQSCAAFCRQTDGRSKRTCELTSSIVPRALSIPPLGGARVSSYRMSSCTVFMLLRPAPWSTELGAVNPDAVHDQPACQGHDRLSSRGAWRSASPRQQARTISSTTACSEPLRRA